MNRLLPAALLSCAAASLSNPAWSFQGFDFFQQIDQSIECVRKPGTDMLVCSNKFVPADDEEEDDANPVVGPVAELESNYFVKVEGAFPDVTDDYWFFLDENESPETTDKWAGHSHLRLADIDNDGQPEIMQIHIIGPGKQYDRQKIITESNPVRTNIVVWDYQDSEFLNVTEEYFSETDLECAVDEMESRRAEIDINQDGQIDIFISCNQEDGATRLAEHGGHTAQLVGLISDFDGTYKIHKFGDFKWWHNVKVGQDEQGIPYVVGAGYIANSIKEDGTYTYSNDYLQNETYYWDHNTNEMITQFNDNYPDIHAGGQTMMVSRYNDFTDLVIQQPPKKDLKQYRFEVGYWANYVMQAYYLDEPYGEWQKTPVVELEYDVVAEVDLYGWESTAPKRRNVVDFNGWRGISHGGDMRPVCEFTLYKDSPPVIYIEAHLQWAPFWQEGDDSQEMDDLIAINVPYFVEFQGGELTQPVPVEIANVESPVISNTQCLDVNNDGYDDIVQGYGNFSARPYWNPPEEMAEFLVMDHRIYINQQDGTFEALDMPKDERIQIPGNATMERGASVFADFDGDGINDVVFFPDNLTRYNSRMVDHMQFYKGTAKILEAQ